MNCIKCGAEIPPNARFCPYCGAEQTAKTNPDPANPFEYTDPYRQEAEQDSGEDGYYGYSDMNTPPEGEAWYSDPSYRMPDYMMQGEIPPGAKSRVTAGVLAILLGALGVHKFYLGYIKQGVITLLITILTFGIAGTVMEIIGVIEGILYLTKSDGEFYDTYELHRKPWF